MANAFPWRCLFILKVKIRLRYFILTKSSSSQEKDLFPSRWAGGGKRERKTQVQGISRRKSRWKRNLKSASLGLGRHFDFYTWILLFSYNETCPRPVGEDPLQGAGSKRTASEDTFTRVALDSSRSREFKTVRRRVALGNKGLLCFFVGVPCVRRDTQKIIFQISKKVLKAFLSSVRR